MHLSNVNLPDKCTTWCGCRLWQRGLCPAERSEIASLPGVARHSVRSVPEKVVTFHLRLLQIAELTITWKMRAFVERESARQMHHLVHGLSDLEPQSRRACSREGQLPIRTDHLPMKSGMQPTIAGNKSPCLRLHWHRRSVPR